MTSTGIEPAKSAWVSSTVRTPAAMLRSKKQDGCNTAQRQRQKEISRLYDIGASIRNKIFTAESSHEKQSKNGKKKLGQ